MTETYRSNLAILGNKGITLAPEVTEQSAGIEIEVQSLNESSRRVGNVADVLGLARWVQSLPPRLHDEGIVHADDEDLLEALGFGGVDVAGDVGFGAGGACGRNC